MKPVTIAYFTSRLDPKVEWFCQSLYRWAGDELDAVQVVFVDRHLWSLTPQAGNRYFRRGDLISLTDERWHVESRREEFERAVDGRFDFLHLPVKPNNFQGPFRLTPIDWWVAAQARNSAIIAAKHPYFVGVDDLSVLLPTFWPQVQHAASSGYCVCGMYQKRLELIVENGEVRSSKENPAGIDTRWAHGSDNGIVPWHGSGLFGCSFGMPTELLLKCNGFDEASDGQSAEDYDLGIRAERAGGKFMLNRNMLTYESSEMHTVEPSMPREKRVMPKDRLPPGYPADGNPDSDHVILWRLNNEHRIGTLSEHTNLRQARAEFLASERAMIPVGPTEDWRTGRPLSELVKTG